MLIREHTPDKNGKVLPLGLSSGSYEFRDLNDNLNGSGCRHEVLRGLDHGQHGYRHRSGLTATKQQWLWCPAVGAAVIIATPGDIVLHNDEVSVNGNTAGFAAGTRVYASGTIVKPSQ